MAPRRPADGGLRPLLRQHLRQVHWTTVESGALAPGTPDVEGCWQGAAFWVELKATQAWAVRIRPEQQGWLLRRARAGGLCYVLTRRQALNGSDELWLHPGATANVLAAGGLRQVDPLLVTAGGPSGWDWEALLRCLASPSGTQSRRTPPRGGSLRTARSPREP